MKRYLLGLFVAFVSIVLVSCSMDDDSYSLNDDWVGFGLLYKTTGGDLGYYIKLDDGDKIFPLASDVDLDSYEDSSRVLVNFTILDDKADSVQWKEFYVRINLMNEILMKGIVDITEQNKDSIGNDPIIVQNGWLSGNLLTFELKYWGDSEVHYINLVKQPGELTSGDQPIELELRHNDRGDSKSYLHKGYVTFDLSAIKIPGLDSVTFKVKATDYDGQIYEEEGIYKYGD